MRLTALCICGTLLAFLSLSWTTADTGEGFLQGDKGFGPCAATLRPAVPCRQGQDDSMCPYLFSLPPLTVHLPKQLRELEKIMKDLQKLKDNVDQLRELCADCKNLYTTAFPGAKNRSPWPSQSSDTKTGVKSPPSRAPKPAEVSHFPENTEFSLSTMKTISLDSKTPNSLEADPLPHLHVLPEAFTMSPDSRITSDLRPQTASQPSSSIPMTTRPNKAIRGILPSEIPSASPGSTKPNPTSKGDSGLRAKILHNIGKKAPSKTTILSPNAQLIPTVSSDFKSTDPATSGPEAPAVESSTSSARELRVKIQQVPAFPYNSPKGRPLDRHPKEHLEDNQGGNKSPTRIPSEVTVARDCSDLLLLGETKSGVYQVTPDGRSLSVFCDMEQHGGGWTVLQNRQDGSVSFNRTWAQYRAGFGELDGEFWLGNDIIHLLTRDREMMLFVELVDFEGGMGYAQYDHFRVSSERLRYKLSVRGYSGTAGDSFTYSRSYDHNNRWFTTPDRDHDRYPSGNCGAYYSSGWWFDACMAANLNGRYYTGRYKGIRDGIFWGTWHNISTEYYPTNDRQSFKSVRMMIRPKGFTP
ncbi:fibroleukin-like [Scomber japonicus]|uniref:fibroleukin-like n=1 Tax=Scomber japonicus TaxID=13676 RepID=UPI0023051138|nr:fibroleukin-like [Scomber japonicus]